MNNSTQDGARLTVGTVLTEFGMIDSLLRSTYRTENGIDPTSPDVRDGDLDACLFAYINTRTDLVPSSKAKVYKGEKGEDIHLQELMQRLRCLRNIAAHQTWSLVTGLSAMPKEVHGQATDSYVGSVDDLRRSWDFYVNQFLPIFKKWNNGEFDI